ncbi:MAG: hypothetical protein LUE20_01990 [Oscillospiraceae bacterium]|nr:hypothetical protein [Oscillospiraceae bacterium]
MKRFKPNHGYEVQTIADIVFKIFAGISIVEGIAIFGIGCAASDGDFGAIFVGLIIGVIIAGIGCLAAWLATLLLRTYGEIVQYTAENASYLEDINNKLSQIVPDQTPANGKKASAPAIAPRVTPAPASPTPTQAPSSSGASGTTGASGTSGGTHLTSHANYGVVYCGACGAANHSANTKCVICGRPLSR